jgi:hypothetical protein
MIWYVGSSETVTHTSIIQMELICGSASEYSQSQMFIWLYTWQICSQLQAVQQNRCIRAKRDSVTQLNAVIPSAEPVHYQSYTVGFEMHVFPYTAHILRRISCGWQP